MGKGKVYECTVTFKFGRVVSVVGLSDDFGDARGLCFFGIRNGTCQKLSQCVGQNLGGFLRIDHRLLFYWLSIGLWH